MRKLETMVPVQQSRLAISGRTIHPFPAFSLREIIMRLPDQETKRGVCYRSGKGESHAKVFNFTRNLQIDWAEENFEVIQINKRKGARDGSNE